METEKLNKGSYQVADEFIPLTAEMLEKNGFYSFEIFTDNSEKRAKKFYFISGDLYWFNGFIYCRYADGMIDLFECKYVHDFRQFINILRIKKDFKL
jgi:hypothetical protein